MNTLDRGELRALVANLAARPEEWRHLVRHEPDQRVYELLRHDSNVMVWLICWMEDHDTGFHDHDISSGAVAVVHGHVREERLRLGPGPAARTLGPGEVFDFEAADIHRVLRRAGRDDQRILAAALAHGFLPDRARGRAAPLLCELRGGAQAACRGALRDGCLTARGGKGSAGRSRCKCPM